MIPLSRLHQQYQQQAQWTRSIRQYLLEKIELPPNPRVLELGCGSGVILRELGTTLPNARLWGIDLERPALQLAKSLSPAIGTYTQCTAAALPFASEFFDLVFCHFFFLWAVPLESILAEARRVLRPGAPFAAFAEPDYGGRVDFPPELAALGMAQEASLRQQGADTRVGRRLAQVLLSQMRLHQVEIGVLGGQWQPAPSPQPQGDSGLLRDDLRLLAASAENDYSRLLGLEEQARRRGDRVEFIPTFYGWGRKSA